jgi:hypothetical protein
MEVAGGVNVEVQVGRDHLRSGGRKRRCVGRAIGADDVYLLTGSRHRTFQTLCRRHGKRSSVVHVDRLSV